MVQDSELIEIKGQDSVFEEDAECDKGTVEDDPVVVTFSKQS